MTDRPSTTINLLEADTRARTARHIIDGFSIVFPTLATFWHQIDGALADTPVLTAEIAHLRTQLTDARLDRANLAAAGRATITAYRNGEADPLGYLRDELHGPGIRQRTGTAMNSPHRIRRQARRMRRYGMQPMVVINSGDALPDLIIVTLGRWLWRYRSELAPFTWPP